MTVVYWIHLKEHTDISKEGYVGVTGCFDTRMSRHYSLTSTFPSHFGKAIRKYGWDNLVKEIIFEGLTEECFKKELELRPSFQIGWNEAIGGLGGDRSFYIDYENRKNIGWNYDKTGERNPFFGKQHNDSSKEKMIKTKSKYIITTPDGVFYSFRAVGRHYGINKITAKKRAETSEGWSYVCK